MKKEYIDDFVQIAEKLHIKVGEIVQDYENRLVTPHYDKPSEAKQYNAYLKTMKKYVVDYNNDN